MRNKLTTACVLASALVVASCGSGVSDSSAGTSTTTPAASESSTTEPAASGPEELVVGESNVGLVFPFGAAIGEGIKDRATELGIELIQLDSGSDAAQESTNVQDLIGRDVDGILLSPVDAAAATAVADTISSAGIPLVAVHTQVGADREQADLYTGIDAYVTQDEVAAGAKAAEIVIEAVPEGGEVAIIEGAAGFAEVENRQKDFRTTIESSDVGFEIVANQPGDWTQEGGEAACQNILSANPNVSVFYAQSDDMGVGCARAVSAADSTAVIVGIGGSELGIEAVGDGTMLGTVCYRPYDMGYQAMGVIAAILEGETVEPYQPYETPKITAENIDDCDPQW